MIKLLHNRDFNHMVDLYLAADYWISCGYRVFIQSGVYEHAYVETCPAIDFKRIDWSSYKEKVTNG